MSNPAPTPGLTAGRVNGEKNTLGPGEEKKMIDDLPTEPAYEADSP